MIDKNGYALMHGSPPDEPLWVPEPEDVYLGWLVKSLGVKFTEGSRYNVFEDDRGPTRLPIPFPRKYYHYRCKNTEDREKDIWAMKEIHKELGGHMSTYDEIIERFKDAEVSYENVFANSPGVAASLRMKGVHQPWSLKEVEFHIMQETVKINGLLRGYEVATAFGISTLGIGLGFKETGGRLVTMDAYIEENSVDGAAYRHEFDKKFYDSKGYRSVTNLIKCYGLQETVYPTVGWSPIDTVSCLSGTFNLDKEKLDFVFIDAGHWDEALLKDVQSVLPFLNQDKYVIFIHDTHGFSKGGLAAVEKLVGNSIVWLPSCMPHDGFCLSYIAKGVEVFQG
jgi:predicted O-methyltransferase YrrM